MQNRKNKHSPIIGLIFVGAGSCVLLMVIDLTAGIIGIGICAILYGIRRIKHKEGE